MVLQGTAIVPRYCDSTAVLQNGTVGTVGTAKKRVLQGTVICNNF